MCRVGVGAYYVFADGWGVRAVLGCTCSLGVYVQSWGVRAVLGCTYSVGCTYSIEVYMQC